MASKAAQTASMHYLQFDIQWASIALLYYDYALTFTSEVEHIWRSKLRFSTVLYVLCRYALVANVLYLLAISKHLGERLALERPLASLRRLIDVSLVAAILGTRSSGC
ncbi:hypothetical protein V5O48_011263 [Marasmius crinis-equi]|uniref:DUF6533 domain-containing protein n=1 Tax=Marasmius crinis-equi TaxID=585013 RepID=A0ABR3F646_9AGAR